MMGGDRLRLLEADLGVGSSPCDVHGLELVEAGKHASAGDATQNICSGSLQQRPRTKTGENWTTGICTGRFGSAGGVTRSTKAIRWIETCSDLFSSLTHAVVAHPH